MIKKLFNKPKIIGVIADQNEGKSNTLYYFLEELNKIGSFSLFTYGLRSEIPKATKIHSVDELEKMKDSICVIDEFFTLFDLDNRKAKRQIENTIRLIHHNNNILVLAGLPENYKKFISGKVNIAIFKRCAIDDFINGSTLKKTIISYCGVEKGSKVLSIPIDEALIYDGQHYHKIEVPYLKKYDSKAENEPIVKIKKGGKK